MTILTGPYPEFLDRRAVRHGALGVGLYETFALQSYQNAAGRTGIDPATRDLFGLIAETFPIARRSLNRMSDRCFF